jgi:hypothetical protein
MLLTTINWNWVYSAQPLMRALAKQWIKEHYWREKCLRKWGAEIAKLRYVLVYSFKFLCSQHTVRRGFTVASTVAT